MLPKTTERHNAEETLALRGAAGMVLDADALEDLWRQAAVTVENPETLRLLSENILKMALPDADDKIVDKVFRNRCLKAKINKCRPRSPILYRGCTAQSNH